MQTEYANPGMFFGMEFGKPVRLPQIKKNSMRSQRGDSSEQAAISRQKQKQNLQNRTNAFGELRPQPHMLERKRSDNNIQEMAGQQMVGSYKIGAIIGKGSDSVVRVVRSWKGKIYAMKTYSRISRGEVFKLKNACNQIEIMKSLDHPQVLKLIDSISSHDSIHIVTELIESRSLKDLLKTHGANGLPLQELKPILKSVLTVLDYLHSHNVAHRDLKLENILISREGLVKLIDFGYSVKSNKFHHDFCGTPHYMSPELISKGGYLADKADIWAAGVLFYKLATGVFPFKGISDKILFRKICRGEYEMAILNAEISKIVQDMLHLDCSERPSAAELLRRITF